MLNGRPVDVTRMVEKGYARLTREWRDGDTVELCMAMPVERTRANPAVRQANGKVALQRGPVVYCLEETDNPITPLTRYSGQPVTRRVPPAAAASVTAFPGPSTGVTKASCSTEPSTDFGTGMPTTVNSVGTISVMHALCTTCPCRTPGPQKSIVLRLAA